jgi:ribonuclease P protein component
LAGFPRRVRLLTPAQFKRVFDSGRREHVDVLMAVAAPNDCGEARLGMAIARKSVRLAVDRNRIKRQLREQFRAVHAELPACDIVVTAKTAVNSASPEQLRAQIDRLWTRIATRWPKRSSS